MLRSIWMHAWDLTSGKHEELIAALRDCGLNACNLAFSYHGGRMFLPRHPRRKVYEQDLSAVYFPIDEPRYRGLRWQPHAAREAALVREFLAVAQQADFPVHAWTVLCHNDRLGLAAPDCCITNVFGERYSYALCPAHPDVRAYLAALCGDLAAQSGVASLDLEALSFMGFEHQSLHDKTGVPLTPLIKWLLSICLCSACRTGLGPIADEIAEKARARITDYARNWPAHPADRDLSEELFQVFGADRLNALLAARRCTLTTLLDEIRSASGQTPLNVRLATSPLFCGGKAVLDWSDLTRRADAATITFFGATPAQMETELKRLPPRAARQMSVYGGAMFHHPDCASAADVRTRIDLLREHELDGQIFYCLGMATATHLDWLKQALR